MSRYLKLLMGTLVMAVLVAPGSLLAAQQQTTTKVKEKKAKVYAKIAAVDAVKNTVTITDVDGKDTEYKVVGVTISLDGKSVKLSELTAGLLVDIGVSAGKLTRLEATTPPDDKPDKPDKKAKK